MWFWSLLRKKPKPPAKVVEFCDHCKALVRHNGGVAFLRHLQHQHELAHHEAVRIVGDIYHRIAESRWGSIRKAR